MNQGMLGHLMLVRSSKQLACFPRKHGPQDEVYAACQLARCQWAAAIAATCSAWASCMHPIQPHMTASLGPAGGAGLPVSQRPLLTCAEWSAC